MLNIEYTVNPQESANATLDFLSNRPVLSYSFFLMKGACLLLCVGFAITYYNGQSKPQDYLAVVLALVWIFFYKNINRQLIKFVLKKTKFEASVRNFSVDETTVMGIRWKSLKYVLKNRDGYIVPITGFSNAGKFVWLPYRAFTDKVAEQQFIEYAKKFRLKLKDI